MRRPSSALAPLFSGVVLLSSCATPPAAPPEPSESESYERPDTVDRMHSTLRYTGWWQDLSDDQRSQVDDLFPAFCAFLDDHIEYGDITGDTQEVTYQARDIAYEEATVLRAEYFTIGGKEKMRSGTIQQVTETGVDVHCDKHAQVIDELYAEHLDEANEVWDEIIE